jgi:pilus assembly protein CpaF
LALNSGIPGFCTIHANSATEALEKLSSLPMLASANLSADFAARMVKTAVALVVHCERANNGKRTVSQILELRNAS